MTTGKDLRELREIAGICQLDLSKAVGITQTALSLMERGYADPDPTTVAAIRQAIGQFVSERNGKIKRLLGPEVEMCEVAK